jgi:hypothetical protein
MKAAHEITQGGFFLRRNCHQINDFESRSGVTSLLQINQLPPFRLRDPLTYSLSVPGNRRNSVPIGGSSPAGSPPFSSFFNDLRGFSRAGPWTVGLWVASRVGNRGSGVTFEEFSKADPGEIATGGGRRPTTDPQVSNISSGFRLRFQQ